MHDPDFLAFELHAPIPVLDRWRSRRCRESGERPSITIRGTGPANRGQRVYPWWQLQGYRPRIGPYVFTWPPLIEAWHHEPGGADSGTICKGRHGGVRWLIAHRKHLSWRLMPYLRVKRWLLDRCEDCGKRFRWREARFGTGWDAPGVLHDPCRQVRHLRGQVVDLARYVRDEADQTNRWRVERTWLGEVGDYWRERGVGPPATGPNPQRKER